MRLFIAIALDNEILQSVTGLQHSLQRQGVRGNYTSPENLHLTLAFIGDYPDPDHVLDTMQTIPFCPFELRLDGYGHFGDLWWAGIQKSDALISCTNRLRHALADAGIPFDKKRFSPHITLVRKASLIVKPELTIPASEMIVDKISLFRSERGKKGMIYTELGSVPS